MNKYLQILMNSVGADHKRIVRGLLLVSIFVLAGKIVGAAKEIAIAYRFGLSEIVDVYVLAFTLAVWLPGMAASVLNGIYVPLIHKMQGEERMQFIRQLTGLGIAAAGAVTLIALVVFPWLADRVSTEFTPEARTSIRLLALGFAPVAGLGLLTALFSAMLLAEEKHANTLFEVIPSLTLIILILAWSTHGGIQPLLWGTLLGVGLQTTGLFLLLRHSNIEIKPKFQFNSPAWLQFKQNIGIVFLGQFVISFIEPISVIIAADLGTGSVSGLGYSSRVLMLFLSLGGTAISRAILPILSKNQRNEQKQIQLGLQWASIMFVVGSVCTIVLWFFAPILVQMLLERGAFTAENTAAVSRAIRFGVFQFPFYFSGVVLAQLFFSLGNFRLILLSSVIALTVKVACSVILARHFQFAGIIFASVPMYAATNLLFVMALRNRRSMPVSTPKD